MEKQLPTPWVWTVCNLPLRCQIGSNIAIWALKPSIALTHPKSDDIEPNVKLSIDTEKSFQYSDDLGWNWHKSWNIPTISLGFDITDPNTKEKLLCPADFKAHLFAVKPFIGNENKLTLIDIGLQGTTQVDIIDGKAVFQGLKFASTSFNNEGVKFHLIICVYLQITEDSKPKILKAMISPPIFVDSRRGIRENEKSTTKDNPLFVYGEPFFPDKFTKKFIKKDPKKKDAAHEDIQNSIEGLFSYLVAANIRNKIRHPAFLSVRFSACASLYYNPTKITNKDLENFIEIYQSLIHEDLTSRTVPQEVDMTHSFFLMFLDIDALEDKLKRKKLLELVNPIRYKSLSVVFQKSEIPSYFVQLTDLKWIADLYTKCYPNIMSSNKDLFNDEDEQDDENSADKIPPPEKQLVVFKEDTGPTDEMQWRRFLEFTEQIGEPTKKIKDERNSPSINVFEDSIKDPRQQMLGNLKTSAQNNVINLEQNPMLRNPAVVGVNNAVFFNPLQGQIAPFARPGLDPSQIPAMWLPGQNIPGAFPQHFAAYSNMGVNPAAFPMMGYNAGVPIAAGANPMIGLNVQQPMLSRDLNKAMANYMMGVQGQDQQELMEIKRETESVPYYTVKSEGNIKEEDEV